MTQRFHNAALPWVPTVNTYWRRAGRGMILSDRARAYREAVIAALTPRPKRPLVGPLFFRAVYYRPDNRRRDLDNLLKGLLDALKYAGAYEDDSQVCRIDVRWGRVEKGGRVDVLIVPLDPLRDGCD